MPERDAEGRPVATHNAGAFLAPLGGVIPAPSSMLDEEGSASEPAVDPQLRTRFRVGVLVTAVAIWALLGAGFRYLLAATEDAAEVRPTLVGDEMTRLMHTDASWYLVNVVVLSIGVFIAMRLLPGRTRDDWLWVGAGSLIAALVIGVAIAVVGGFSAAVLAIIAAAWLILVVVARRQRVGT